MRHRRDEPAKRGFALLEVLITLSVAAIALTAVIRLQAALQRNGTVARERAAAISVAADRLERLRTTMRITGIAGPGVSPSDAVQRQGVRYQRTVAIDSGAVPPVVDITVTWEDSTGRRRSVRLVSLLDPDTASDSAAAVAAARRAPAR